MSFHFARRDRKLADPRSCQPALSRAVGRAIEALESRVLFSDTLLSGPGSIDAGSPYTVNLNAVPQPDATFSINWGDGTAVQTVPGRDTTATHTFADATDAAVTHTITATATGLANPTDTSFGPADTGKVVTSLNDDAGVGYRTLVQPDGKVVVAGGVGFAVARYDADGTPDPTFNGTGTATQAGAGVGYGLALQPDGKILVGGGVNFGLCRLNPDGSLDPTFGTGGLAAGGFGSSYVGYDLALLPSGKVLMVGQDATDFVAARFNADGSLDASFGTGGKVTTAVDGLSDRGFTLAVAADGSFFVAGQSLVSGSTHYCPALPLTQS